MRPSDRSTRSPSAPNPLRFGDPVTLVCAALVLAVLVLSTRIISLL